MSTARRRPPARSQSPKRTSAQPLWDLRLYVLGSSPKSTRALRNLSSICETHLKGRYRLTVIDLEHEPQRARRDQILAAPTLLRRRPAPVAKIVGDLSDTARVLAGLDLVPSGH